MNKVFEVLEQLRKECYKDLTAQQASNILLKVSALYANIIELAIDAEMEYNRRFESIAGEVEKVTEARARAKASPEYENMLRMQAKVEVTKELIRSLKYLLKVKLDEYREAKYE